MKTSPTNHSKKGFTLIELMVSIALFVIFLGVVSVSFINIIRSQRQADTVRKMYSDVRSFVESVGEDMRLGTIDYDCYTTGTSGPTPPANDPCPIAANLPDITLTLPSNESPYLAIINKDQTDLTVYYFDSTNGKLKEMKFVRPQGSSGPDLTSWAVDPSGEQTLMSDLVSIQNLTFSVYPPLNPYLQANYGQNQYQFQPKVTLTLSVANASSNVTPFSLNFQTTLSSRVYSRSS